MSVLTVEELYAAKKRVDAIVLGCKGEKRWEQIKDFYKDGQWWSGIVDWQDQQVYYFLRPEVGLGPLGRLRNGQTETKD